MIDRKYYTLLFAFFMALLMSSIMSMVITVFNVGLVPNIISIWLKAWAVAFVVALPTTVLVAPLVIGGRAVKGVDQSERKWGRPQHCQRKPYGLGHSCYRGIV